MAVSFTLDDLKFLTSDTGDHLLRSLAEEDLSESNTLTLITRLRKDYTLAQGRAALTLARLRRKAIEKFGDAGAKMLFTDDALQQASDPFVRRYRAGLIEGQGTVLDLCCGIGADALAFAAQGLAVTGVDIDPIRLHMAEYNSAVLDLKQAQFLQADVTNPKQYPALNTSKFDLIFFDPARRDAEGRRIYHVEQYLPPLSTIYKYDAWKLAVKLSPGVDIAQVASYPAHLEFISVAGDLKESVLWFDGNFAAPSATLITDDENIYHWQRDGKEPHVPVSEPLQWLVEPDPAIIRAGLVRDMAAAFNGVMLDETIAYFTSPGRLNTPWGRCWRIIDWMPFNLKKLRAYLRERHIGTITVKKRGSPLTPEELIRKLKLKGENSCTVVLTHFAGAPFILICDDYTV